MEIAVGFELVLWVGVDVVKLVLMNKGESRLLRDGYNMFEGVTGAEEFA